MTRLIDVDGLKADFNLANPNEFPMQFHDIIAMIDKQPTAYDIDKVVEQLKEKKVIRFNAQRWGDEYVVKFDEAISIVKGGGEYDL